MGGPLIDVIDIFNKAVYNEPVAHTARTRRSSARPHLLLTSPGHIQLRWLPQLLLPLPPTRNRHRGFRLSPSHLARKPARYQQALGQGEPHFLFKQSAGSYFYLCRRERGGCNHLPCDPGLRDAGKNMVLAPGLPFPQPCNCSSYEPAGATVSSIRLQHQ